MFGSVMEQDNRAGLHLGSDTAGDLIREKVFPVQAVTNGNTFKVLV